MNPSADTPRPTIEELFAEQRRVDPFGHNLHTWLAMAWCALVGAPTSFVELGVIPVALCFLIRWPRHRRTLGPLCFEPTLWLLGAWTAWLALSIAWSGDPRLGVQEWSRLRFAYSILALWPVMDRRLHLIGALAVGLLAANGAQAVHAIGLVFHLPAITFPRMPDRNSGWWEPVVGGSMLTGALGLHLGAAILPGPVRARTRLLGIGGAIVSLVGVLATGSRGAWIASGALLAVTGIIALTRIRDARKMLEMLPLGVAVLVLIGAAGWWTLGPLMVRRAETGIADLRTAIQDRDFGSDTGARLMMARWAIEAVRAHPLTGVGAGGYKAWVTEHLREQGEDPAAHSIHAHAHNALLQVAATTGLVGLGLACGIVVIMLRGAARGLGTQDGAGYQAGPLFALIGLLLVSAFDVVQVNAQTAALLSVFLTLSLPCRPRTSIGALSPSPEVRP